NRRSRPRRHQKPPLTPGLSTSLPFTSRASLLLFFRSFPLGIRFFFCLCRCHSSTISNGNCHSERNEEPAVSRSCPCFSFCHSPGESASPSPPAPLARPLRVHNVLVNDT